MSETGPKNKEATPRPVRRIERVRSLKELRAVSVSLDNGKTYVLRLDDLSGADSSGLRRVTLARKRNSFRIHQESTNVLDVPWDAVLFHCESDYEYYKDRQPPDDRGPRAVGNRVRKLRESKGLTVTTLAELTGMKRPNLSRLEAGRHLPSLETLERIARALQVPVAELVVDQSNPASSREHSPSPSEEHPDREQESGDVDVASREGVSPYSTGGGGVTFERKVAVQYLTHLLVGDWAVELGDGRSVVSVAFQQAPHHSVDDLVLHAARGDESEPSLILALGIRRAPDLVQSDESSQKLIREFVRAMINTPEDGAEHRFALVVAGAQPPATQLAKLADLAAVQADARDFFDLLRTPGKFSVDIRGRLDQTEMLVRNALIDLGISDPDSAVVQQRTWGLLSRLTVLMPRLESPDETDWATITNTLIPVARGTDLAGASRLRDRLAALSGEYAPKAATIDLVLLRRDVHALLDVTVRRHQQGWQALDHLHERAFASVRDEIIGGDGTRRVHVDRSEAATKLLAAATDSVAVLVHGESGVGKSALALLSVTAAAAANPDTLQALCVNMRQLPATTLELETTLGSPLATLLGELSAPNRILIVDSAEAVAEGMVDTLRYLVDAARQSDVRVVAVTVSDSKQVVRDTIAQQSGANVTEYAVPALTDSQIDEVVATFAELSSLAANPRSRELLRRPIVIDLLARGGVSGVPLNDSDAMREVWSGLVRRHEQADRGTPGARQFALLRLAKLALAGGDALEVVGTIDAAALEGLRRDGLLAEDPFKIGPEFAHEEVRRYAVAHLLLAEGNPASKLAQVGAPRWALSAARLACQALLARPDSAQAPLHGRFASLQAAFDALVDAGHGERWGDVPGEAMLTLGDPDPVLRDAWPALRASGSAGLQRLARLVDQRLRDENGIVNIIAVEPVVTLLLDEETPWWSGDYVQDLLRAWLRAHVVADTSAGHPLRIRLRQRLVAACAAADRRLAEERAAAEAARAARSPEEIEEERQFMESHRALFTEIGSGGRPRRERPEVPFEVTDDIVLELLALLGPDLGDDGEAILRRVAQDAPSRLSPAVEELFTGRALATYRRGFLADLTQAYYVDDEADGVDLYDDGIRHHHARSFGVTPLAAWYRGPFMPLFQSDFRGGVAVLNRMLNHAALVRVRSFAGRHQMSAPVDDEDIQAYLTEFDLSGTRRAFIGDGHVWIWYRGTGVGPYPCVSALQALERVCDQLIEIGIPLETVVAMLLDGCENLAMVGLVVGLLVQHLERADRLLDPFLAEPLIWRLEFNRVVSETSGLAGSSEGLVAPERRAWSMREAAMFLVLQAEDGRAEELRAIGDLLVENARRLIAAASDDTAPEADAEAMEQELAAVRAWASSLDRDSYQTRQTEEGVYIQSTPPDEVVQALQRGSEDLQRAHEATRLNVRYYIEPKKGRFEAVGDDELAADVAVARTLLENPPALNASDPWDTPAAVAAAALEAHLLRGTALPEDALTFSADTLLRVGDGEPSPRQFEFEGTYFEQGADRSAARALPLLLLPVAAPLRAILDGDDGSVTYARAAAAGINLAHAVANEVRLHLARGLDRLWDVPCASDGYCHHEIALQLAIETMRDCVFGDWDPDEGRRRILVLDEPVGESLVRTSDDSIYFSRLDAAIRALAPAAMANVCVSAQARDLLMILLKAQRRSLLVHERDMDHRGTHALVSARALLTLVAKGADAPIYEHIDAYADNSTLLASFLRAVSAAAEETPERAATALRIWPDVIAHVLKLNESGHDPFRESHYGDMALAALVPNSAGEVSYFYREVQNEPILWWEPLAWRAAIEAWLPVAAGNPTCVDHLISCLGKTASEDQVRTGLPWVASLVLADPPRVAGRSFLVSSWLIEIRAAAVDAGLMAEWQRVVDALVVAGVSRLAPYSE